jgi:DNA-binding transcriptional MerR regulator
MADRSHLSIGEVLSLLQDDFPDVTISKIRFLESQGLLDPERTPSGYRKFYEPDIERLRWILRHQRDHFLPLKVIKDRLEEAGARGLVVPPDEPAPGAAPEAPAGPGEGSPQHMSSAPAVDDGGDDDYSPIPAPVRSRAARNVPERPGPAAAAPGVPASPVAEPATGGPAAAPSAPAPPAPAAAAAVPAAPVPARVAEAEPPPAAPAAASRPAARPAPTMPPLPIPTPSDDGPSPLDAGVTGGSFTTDELVAASGIDERTLGDLVRFGLVVGRSVGGDTFYDEDALVSAKAAAGFLRFGIEARHLRMYKVAAEREAGFMEQVVMPLLKQRNPTARQQAADTLGELARLGDQMRAALLRTALRDSTDPR